jgi:hypothetical protein
VTPLPQATMLIYQHSDLELTLHVPDRLRRMPAAARISILGCFTARYSPASCPDRLIPMTEFVPIAPSCVKRRAAQRSGAQMWTLSNSTQVELGQNGRKCRKRLCHSGLYYSPI